MKKLLLLFCFLLSFKSFSAHKDFVKHFQYGNVSGIYITAWANQGHTIDFEILVQLIDKLAKKHSYKDSIFLVFRNKSSTNKPRISQLNKNDLGYGITFHDFGFKEIEIWNYLKLFEYAMKNNFEEEKVEMIRYKDPYDKEEYNGLGMSNDLISKIKNGKESRTIKKIHKEKIPFLDENGIKGFYKNNSYYFKNKDKEFKVNSIENLLLLKKGILVFDTKFSFIYLSPKTKYLRKFILDEFENLSDYPFYSSTINFYLKEKPKEKSEEEIFIYKVWNSNHRGFMFSEDKNEIRSFYTTFKP